MLLIFKKLQILSSQPLRWFVLNGIFATFSNGLIYIAMTWIILNEINSISSLSTLMICFWAPTTLLGPLCGVIADRYSRRKIMTFSNLLRGLFLLALMTIEDMTSTEIYITALALGIMGNLYGPAAFAFIREIVPAEKMFQANAIVAMSYEVGNMVGMGCAGILMSVYPAKIVIAISGSLFLAAVVCLMLIKAKPSISSNLPGTSINFLKSLQEGLSYIWKVKKIRILYTVELLLMVNFLTAPILLAPFAKNILHTNVSQFGIIQAFLSLGIIMGALIAPWLLELWPLKKIVIVKTTVIMLLFLLFSITSNVVTANIIHFFLGFAMVAWTLVVTQAQLCTELDFQARTHAAFNSITAVVILLFYILLDVGSKLISLRGLYVLEATFAAIATYLLWRHRDFLTS